MPDLRAHGLSDKPREPEAYPCGVLARDLHELIAHLDVAQFDLGGFSLGARTTVQAIGEGKRPRKAILAGMGLEGLPTGTGARPFSTKRSPSSISPSVATDWMAIQFMKTMKVDRVAAGLLLRTFEDAHPEWLRGVHDADIGGLRFRGRG